ncbi:MAG TPA: terminase family protein [Sphingomicrobium sp.]|nr:terminase family protein [Sphingomicrobium sp.]
MKRHEKEILKAASEEHQRKAVGHLSFEAALELDTDFEMWAHENQLPPGGEGWRTWLMMAGRGFGKTRAGAEWIFRLASQRRGVRVALIGGTIAEARSIMVEGVSGLLGIARRHRRRLSWEPSLSRLKWPNGSEAQLFSGDNADGLRGPEHDFAWCDELAKWREAEGSWDNLQFGLRRGMRPRALVTTTPKPIPLLGRIGDMSSTIVTRGKTSDNINLDEAVSELLIATYGGTRLGLQELDGELLADVEGALWTRDVIERARVDFPLPAREGRGVGTTQASFNSAQSALSRLLADPPPSPPFQGGGHFDRIVVGVDPPAGVGEGVDACGIVVCGSIGEMLYVLEDATVRGLSPEGWANRVAAAAIRWDTAQVVAEANNGGAMVESVLKAADLGLRVRLVHASRGKCARAEPIALKFETGKAFFAGEFPELEAELGGMIAGGGYDGPGRSPDRADAMVWALTVLSETRSGLPRVRRL